MCFYCWPQQTNPHPKKSVNMHLYWSVGCYSFVTSVNDSYPSPCCNTSSPNLSCFNHHRAGQSHKPGTELMTNLWHGTGRAPAEKSLNNKFTAREKTGEQEGKTMTAIKQTGCQAECCQNIKSGSEEWVSYEEKNVKGWRTGTGIKAWGRHTPRTMNMYGNTTLCYQGLWILV